MKKLLLALMMVYVVTGLHRIQACSAFIIRNHETFLVGRNYDYHPNQGVMMINPRNMQKIALPFPGEVSAQWVSEYGSVTFNAIAREEPIEGINEKGLVIAGLWLDNTQLPIPDNRPAVDDMQWIQYMLDNCADIDEVIAEVNNVRISNQSQARLHYFLSDAKGNFALSFTAKLKTYMRNLPIFRWRKIYKCSGREYAFFSMCSICPPAWKKK